MSRPLYIAAIDLGTTALKACVYESGERLVVRSSGSRRISLDSGHDGRAEQDPEEWWDACASVLSETVRASGVGPASISALSFCAQMQCLVLVDAEGRAVRPAVSYLDSRASVRRERLTSGGPRVAGIGLGLLIPWMRIAGGVAASAKDPLWKYLRVMDDEPDVFSRVHKWLDAKDFLIARCTGRFVMSNDSAYATFLADTRGNTTLWSPNLIRRFGVRPSHLPDILAPSDVAGSLLPSAASSLGLSPGTAVFAGAGDASLIGIGAGAAAPGSTHIYMGTSGWVSTVVERRIVDPFTMMAAVPGPSPGRYAYFGEQETSGKCLEWVRDHLALDEIGVYLDKRILPSGPEEEYKSLIDYLTASIAEIPAGSGGLLFAPWLHGSRSPFEDPKVRGMFFNIGLETGKRQMIRAVVEGLAYNTRMLLEAQERKTRTSNAIRIAGGGALSDETCRIFADVSGRIIEPVVEPQNAGASGAALVAAWGMGRFADLETAASIVPVRDRFEPRSDTRVVHDRNYKVFRDLYPATKRLFSSLNSDA
jgi:xylulokinase